MESIKAIVTLVVALSIAVPCGIGLSLLIERGFHAFMGWGVPMESTTYQEDLKQERAWLKEKTEVLRALDAFLRDADARLEQRKRHLEQGQRFRESQEQDRFMQKHGPRAL